MHFRETIAAAVLALAVGLVPACGGEQRDVSYYQDIKPILDAKCVQCHYEGGVAPFSLATYDDASVYAGVSKLAIEAGTMPPWHASDECNEYVGNRSLTEEQKSLIYEWVDNGTVEGDPANPGEPLVTDATSLSRVDLTVEMNQSYTPQTSADYSDDYRCFVLPWPEQDTTYVSGFRAVPGNPSVVHHVIAFLAQPEDVPHYQQLDAGEPGPGYSCFGGTGGPAREWVGAWAPGGQGSDLPPGLGIEIQPESAIILQVHYNTLYAARDGAIEPDLTSLEFKLDDQVEKNALIMPWANPQWLGSEEMHLPANEPDVEHSFQFDATIYPALIDPDLETDTLEFYSASLHMHLLGTSGRLSIERSDGSAECLLQIDQWDFDWQESYALRTPKTFHSGDQLRIECHWDNSASNQPIVDGEPQPPQDVYWGEGSTDEMCLGIFLVAVP